MLSLKKLISVGAAIAIAVSVANAQSFDKVQLLKAKTNLTNSLKQAEAVTKLRLETIDESINKLKLYSVELQMKYGDESSQLKQKLALVEEELKKIVEAEKKAKVDAKAKVETEVEQKP